MKQTLKFFFAIPLLLLLAVGAAYAVPSTVTWVPAPATWVVTPGEQGTYSEVLTHTGIYPIPIAQQLRVVAKGAIAPYVTITQPTFPTMFKRGNQVTVGITVSVPNDTPFGTINGTLELKRILPNKTYLPVLGAAPLTVKVDVWPGAEVGDSGITIAYPPGWYVTQKTNAVAFSNVIERGEPDDTTFQTETFFQIRLRANDNQLGLPIDQWFDQLMRPVLSENLLHEGRKTVDGHDSFYVEVAGVGGRRAYIYVPQNMDVVEISYGLFAPHFVADYEAMVESFFFSE